MKNKFGNEGETYTLDKVINDMDFYSQRVEIHLNNRDYASALFLLENIGDGNIEKGPLYFDLALKIQGQLDENKPVGESSTIRGNKSYEMAKALVEYCMSKCEKYVPTPTTPTE